MIQTSVPSTNNNILILPLPEQYRGKDIEVFIYSKDELVTLQQKQAVTLADFKGTIAKEDAEQLRLHTQKAREEWDRDFLIDTNVIIDVLDNALPQNGKVFIATLPPVVPEVTRMELLGWLNATPSQLAPVQTFVIKATLLPINEPVIIKVIEIKQMKKIKLGDAIIAATALVHNLTLITRNTNDFKNIAGLNAIDPHSV